MSHSNYMFIFISFLGNPFVPSTTTVTPFAFRAPAIDEVAPRIHLPSGLINMTPLDKMFVNSLTTSPVDTLQVIHYPSSFFNTSLLHDTQVSSWSKRLILVVSKWNNMARSWIEVTCSQQSLSWIDLSSLRRVWVEIVKSSKYCFQLNKWL